ncbi:F-box domain, FBD domain, Leucine-rich repeat domain, L domain-like protein [Artemisia annua]|uniref:F-box domain, FBD domain, Leucine-rich repeat domain, L domain-like protein n=1 Tax=Artemisia annua TaxID=35608 RepID=A0A2U1LF66_ARTAN|nr:F-box domain, FBD domain, Leucine-rich repeat domain, L domain-like protein [Artemisia annua]
MPDPILHLILSCLPTTEDVVRTSILSTRWRYLWTSVSSLDIDCSRGKKRFKKIMFKEFVNSVLLNKTLDLVSFRLCCLNHYDVSTVTQWIQEAIMRNVKSLDLMFSPRVKFGVISAVPTPFYLVTVDSLEVLRLCLYGHSLRASDGTRFRALRVLELNQVDCFDVDLVEQCLEKSPLLEELSLIDCLIKIVDPVCISSPKLKSLIIRNWKNVVYKCERFWCGLEISCPELLFFEYVGRKGEFILKNVDSLKKTLIFPEDTLQQKVSPRLGKAMCKLLAGISHVESLSLNLYFIRCIDAACDPDRNFPASFPNLKKLEEHLMTDYWVLDEVETRRILTRHLKKVEFLEFNGEKLKLDIACFLLEQGNLLEEMVFRWDYEYHEKAKKAVNKMSKLNKASSTVKLISVL